MSLMDGGSRDTLAHPSMNLTFEDICVSVDGNDTVEGTSRLSSMVGVASYRKNNILNGASGVLNSGEVC
jgi:hypothetical protein